MTETGGVGTHGGPPIDGGCAGFLRTGAGVGDGSDGGSGGWGAGIF